MTHYSFFQSNDSMPNQLSHFFDMIGTAVSQMAQFSATATSTAQVHNNQVHSDDEMQITFACNSAACNPIVDLDEEVASLLYETSHDVGVSDSPIGTHTLN
ncbi:MAG TPA: hypothetical protein DCW33_03280 [Proteobacteria bacterium]|nr:hypothetical protein [Pseudomonadota bacterium]